MGNTLVIEGVSLTDISCTLNTPGLPHVTYNVSRITADAILGRFGPHKEEPVARLETLGPGEEWRNLDQSKVLWMARCFRQGTKVKNPFPPGQLCHIIDIPLLAVTLRLGHTHGAVVPVDGNHRLKARMLLGAQTFQRFVVPEELEGNYRVRIREI